MARLPFSVFRRKGRRFFYVQFKCEGGGYLPAVSTKQVTEAAAMEAAFRWLREGVPSKVAPAAGGGAPETAAIGVSLKEALRGVSCRAEAEFVCKELKRQGFLKAYVLAGSRQDADFGGFLENFWDYDNSPYVKEKLRKNHGIHKNYTAGQKLAVRKFWKPFFKGRCIGSVTRGDIESFTDNLEVIAGRRLSAGRKNRVLKAGTIPLRWALSKEIIEKDVTAGIVWFSGECAKRRILSPEIAGALFHAGWRDERARLANLLAAVTGLRAGEIQALRVQDLGDGRLRVRHSWNGRDGLKTTKNNEERVAEVPFPNLIRALAELAARNPHGAGAGGFVFWAEKSPAKPVEGRVFIRGLHDALVKTGMSREEASAYVFHGWRHFFTTYMIGRLEKKLLKSQTGHKTDSMLFKYGDHWTEGDRDKIRKAQLDVFGALMPAQTARDALKD